MCACVCDSVSVSACACLGCGAFSGGGGFVWGYYSLLLRRRGWLDICCLKEREGANDLRVTVRNRWQGTVRCHLLYYYIALVIQRSVFSPSFSGRTDTPHACIYTGTYACVRTVKSI